jgi:tyrosinase
MPRTLCSSHEGNSNRAQTEAGYPFYSWDTTIRSPPQGYVNNATSDNDLANQIFSKQQTNNRDMLYKLLTVYQPFNEWSNKANGGKLGSIETLHDGIHNSFGGNMGIVMASAFDPVFYFHHMYVALCPTRIQASS